MFFDMACPSLFDPSWNIFNFGYLSYGGQDFKPINVMTELGVKLYTYRYIIKFIIYFTKC